VARPDPTRSTSFSSPDPATFKTFLDVAPDSIVIVDQDGRITYVNSQTEHLFGYGASELLGKTVDVLLPAWLRSAHDPQGSEDQEKPVSRPLSESREVVGRHKDGTEIPVEINLSAVTIDRGSWVMSVIRDLRGRRAAQPERDHPQANVAREREDVKAEAQHAPQVLDAMRTVADTIPAGLIVADANGTIVFSNTAARQLLGGVIAGSVNGSDSRCTLHRRDGSLFPRGDLPLAQAIKRGETIPDVEILVRHPERPERVMLNTAQPQRDSAGQISGAIVVFQDITRREQAEEELGHLARMLDVERSRLQSVLDSAINPIIYVDAKTGEVRANPEAEKLFGHPFVPQDGRAQYADQIHDPDGRLVPFADLPVSRIFHSETTVRQEYLIVRPDGSRVPVVENTAPIRLPDGEVVGAVMVLQDISPLKELERVREEWTSVVAHDLRQPLTVIAGYADQLAHDRRPRSAKARTYADQIVTSSHRLNRMVADLLDASRIEANRLKVERRHVDLAALARDVVERAGAFTEGHKVSVTSSGSIPLVEVDPERIEQVLVNLLSNAAKYGASGSPIEVLITTGDTDIEVAVTNSGPGIAPDELLAIFTRFYRGKSAPGERVAGIGRGCTSRRDWSKLTADGSGPKARRATPPRSASPYRLGRHATCGNSRCWERRRRGHIQKQFSDSSRFCHSKDSPLDVAKFPSDRLRELDARWTVVQAREDGVQLVDVERLGQVGDRVDLVCHGLASSFRRHHDDGNAETSGTQRVGKRPAIHHRHAQVEQDGPDPVLG
jgi:PAS domain S-box-containing protein